MTEEEREKRKQRILGIFADWGAPEERRRFIRAHGSSPAEAEALLKVGKRIIERHLWWASLRAMVKETSAYIVAVGTAAVAIYGLLKFLGVVPL